MAYLSDNGIAPIDSAVVNFEDPVEEEGPDTGAPGDHFHRVMWMILVLILALPLWRTRSICWTKNGKHLLSFETATAFLYLQQTKNLGWG